MQASRALRRIFLSKPRRDILRIEAHRAGNPEGRNLAARGHFVNLLNGHAEDRCNITHAKGLGLVLDEFNQFHGENLAFPESVAAGSPSMMGGVWISVKFAGYISFGRLTEQKKSAEG